MERFVLASASPRRRELLKLIVPGFEIVVSDADEASVSKENVPVDIYVQELAMIKAAAASKLLHKRKQTILISADTIVTLDGRIMGKPADESEAFSMLSALSGRDHEVYTGYCVMRLEDGLTVCGSEKTTVAFKELNEDTINNYIRTGEPMDKAGAYGIQGKGALLVKGIHGDYHNVVGLPVSSLADTLKKEFDIDVL